MCAKTPMFIARNDYSAGVESDKTYYASFTQGEAARVLRVSLADRQTNRFQRTFPQQTAKGRVA